MNALVSVVTPTYRPVSYWERQLGWLQAQSLLPGLFEWVIVDDLWESSRTTVLNWSAGFTIRHMPPESVTEFMSVSSALNDGIRASTGQLIYFMADYMQPLPGTLHRHVQLYDVYGPNVFIGGAVLPHERRWETLISSDVAEVKSPGLARGAFWGGRNDSASRDALVAVNGFDERLDGYRGAMDADLAHRLLNYGCRFIIDRQLATGAGMHGHDQSKPSRGEQERNPLWPAISAKVVGGESWANHARRLDG